MKRIFRAAMIAAVLAGGAAGGADSPYAGWQARGVKSLSPIEIERYLSGDGAGFALAAELNHYPGPRHVLELQDALSLSESQIETARAMHSQMREEAVALGRRLVAAESELNALFASGGADDASLAERVAQSARIRGDLRLTHLRYHLRMREILSPDQIALYDALRGYGDESDSRRSHSHSHDH